MIPTNKKSHSMELVTVCLVIAFLTSGCSIRLADLTLVSTKNIDLSNARFDVTKGQRTKGEDCAINLLGIPLGIPTLEKAVDNALEKGGGNVMIDQVTYSKLGAYFIIGSQQCIEVEGTVLNTSTK